MNRKGAKNATEEPQYNVFLSHNSVDKEAVEIIARRLREEAQHKGNLHKLREQAAIYAAGETPLHLLNQIEAEEVEIRRIEKQLRDLQRGGT